MDVGVALWFGMVNDGYVCDMGVGFGLVMLPMDFSVFPMMEKDSWKVETDMRSVKWLFVVFYITKIGIMNACECANDETMVVETCGLINRCALPVDAWSENGGLMDGVVG